MNPETSNKHLIIIFQQHFYLPYLNFIQQILEPNEGDRYFLSNKVIDSNILTLKFTNYGVGILTHELGHAVSQFLEKQEINKKAVLPNYDCINSWHMDKRDYVGQQLNLSEPFSKDSLISKYLEEDWADYFSALVLKEYKKTHSWVRNPIKLLAYYNYLLKLNVLGGYDLWHSTDKVGELLAEEAYNSVSYTHLTLPTNREV